MIRLNDINKTVIDESKVVAYYGYEEEKDYCVCIALNGNRYIDYNSKELRDKDIELLDKLFDVKSIKYKAMSVAKPELYSNGGGINEESTKIETKYITSDYLKECEADTLTYVEMPNGEIRTVYYDVNEHKVVINCIYGDTIDDSISEDLFNALRLKMVD